MIYPMDSAIHLLTTWGLFSISPPRNKRSQHQLLVKQIEPMCLSDSSRMRLYPLSDQYYYNTKNLTKMIQFRSLTVATKTQDYPKVSFFLSSRQYLAWIVPLSQWICGNRLSVFFTAHAQTFFASEPVHELRDLKRMQFKEQTAIPHPRRRRKTGQIYTRLFLKGSVKEARVKKLTCACHAGHA